MTTNSITLPLQQAKNRHLPPIEHRFKPGQSGNPKGRKPDLLTKKEKLFLLAEIARHKIESPVSAGHKVTAIREANLMENVYREGGGYQDNRQINIVIAGAESKELLQRVGQTFLQQPAEVKEVESDSQ